MPLRVAHVTPSFHPAFVYGGPTESTLRLCESLAREGCEVRVLTTDANGPRAVLDVDTTRELEVVAGVHVRYCRRLMADSVAASLVRLLPGYVRWADVVHLTAVYSFPTIPTLLTCRRADRPLVWSPRGSLQRWRGSTRTALKALWELGCRRVTPRRLRLHVTSQEEAEESRRRFPGAVPAIVPNGVLVPPPSPRRHEPGTFRMLFLGRIHPIKGLDNLLEACAILNRRSFSSWRLAIAGAGDPDYVRLLERRIAALALSAHVAMIGEVQGPAKEAAFAAADVQVLPSHRENFGIVVAEALARGLPVVAGRGTPWSGIEERECGLWVDNDPESLADAIRRIAAMPLDAMGNRGRSWMEREFSWGHVARTMIELYREIATEAAAGTSGRGNLSRFTP